MSGVFLYWALVLVLVVEVRRELTGAPGRRTALTVLLYAALAVAVAGAVVLTGLRLSSAA